MNEASVLITRYRAYFDIKLCAARRYHNDERRHKIYARVARWQAEVLARYSEYK